MTYLVFAAAYFVIFAWRPFMLSLDFTDMTVMHIIMVNFFLIPFSNMRYSGPTISPDLYWHFRLF